MLFYICLNFEQIVDSNRIQCSNTNNSTKGKNNEMLNLCMNECLMKMGLVVFENSIEDFFKCMFCF